MIDTLEELLARLRRSQAVDAVAIIGSAAEGNLNATSDYDLLIVLKEPPVPLAGGVTYLDGRLTDIVFAVPEDIERLNAAAAEEISMYGIQGSIVRWMPTARIEFDSSGGLSRLQEKAKAGMQLRPLDKGEIYSRYDRAGYNLAHTKRMLASGDPVQQTAIDMRLLYQLADLMVDYFQVRGLPWQGEKKAVSYWKSQDPDYLSLFVKCLDERDRARKVSLYDELAQVTMAPVGVLWTTGDTRFRLEPDSEATSQKRAAAEAFWQSLLDSSITDKKKA